MYISSNNRIPPSRLTESGRVLQAILDTLLGGLRVYGSGRIFVPQHLRLPALDEAMEDVGMLANIVF